MSNFCLNEKDGDHTLEKVALWVASFPMKMQLFRCLGVLQRYYGLLRVVGQYLLSIAWTYNRRKQEWEKARRKIH